MNPATKSSTAPSAHCLSILPAALLSLAALHFLVGCEEPAGSGSMLQPSQNISVARSSSSVAAPNYDQLMARLNLTEDQKPRFTAILEDARRARIAVRQDTSLSTDARLEKYQVIAQERINKLKYVLTSEQLAQYQALTRPRSTASGAQASRGTASQSQQPFGAAAASQPRFDQMSFDQLLASKDPTSANAQARNHALLSFKTLRLPALLRDTQTPQLTALTVQIEQTVLDLNRESELAKDHAQQAVQTGSGNVDQFRELSLLYKDRIEILKPILIAIKEETANRNK
jgi:hypothetical protein